MANIYISSTYSDLKTCREIVYKALRQLRHDVIAMEDYIATDQRPLDKCLADVAACDAYVGIFAWRYGYVPPTNNPGKKSITELEYRHAVDKGRPCFLFLLHEEAPWPRSQMEKGELAERLDAFRADLSRNHVISFFRSAEELAGLVTVAVTNHHSRFPVRAARIDAKPLAPPLPVNYIERPAELERVRRLVLNQSDQRDIALTALEGMGGIGKSVLAAALCRDESVRAAFPDGVVWITIGREPGNLVRQVGEVGRALGDTPENYDTPETSTARLGLLLQHKAALLVLDDVWDVRHFEPFRVDAPGCRILFTTRDSNIALSLGAQEVRLGVFEPDEALVLLHEWAGRDDPNMMAIAERLGYLPVALKLAGARLREGMTGKEWLNTFQYISQMRLTRRSTDRSDNLQVCFDLSVEQLSEADRILYYALGIFPEDALIPQGVIDRVWRQIQPTLSQFDCDELITDFGRLALVEQDTISKTVTLHDLLYDYTREKLSNDLPATHMALLVSYNSETKPWFEITNDGYLYNHLAYHLCGANHLKALRELLIDFRWLQAKLTATSVNALLMDYVFVPNDPTLRLIESAIRLSARILTRDPTQLPSQLYGRLMATSPPEIQQLLVQIRQGVNMPWLRLLTPTLEPAGGQLVCMMSGHDAAVLAVTMTLDARHVISGDRFGCLKLWDFASGIEMRTLLGHEGAVYAVAVTPDGRHVISASGDRTLKVWDFASGNEVRTLSGHEDAVYAVAVTPDGRHVISASGDGTLKLWDLMNGQELYTFRGHLGAVTGLALTPDGLQAISGSYDNSLAIWDIKGRKTTRSLEGHYSRILSVSVISSQTAVSASGDRTLRVWDLERGIEKFSLTGHLAPVNAVAIAPDGRTAVSVSDDGDIRVWDLERRQQMSALTGHLAPVNAIAIAPDGRTAISVSDDTLIKVWDLGSSRSSDITTVSIGEARALFVTPYGPQSLLLIDDKTLAIWDLEKGAIVSTIESPRRWGDAIAVIDEWHVVMSFYSGVMVCDLQQRKATRIVECGQGTITAVAATPDGKLAISASDDYTLKIWDLVHGRQVSKRDTDQVITCIVVTPDGQQVVLASERGDLAVWKLERLVEYDDWLILDQQRREWEWRWEWSKRNEYKEVPLDVLVKMRSVQGMHQLSCFDYNPYHRGDIYRNSIMITADGRRVLSNSGRIMRAWDLESERELQEELATLEWDGDKHTIKSENEIISTKLISADGRRCLRLSEQGVATVWDLDNENIVCSFRPGGSAEPRMISLEGGLALFVSYKHFDHEYEIQLWDLKKGNNVCNVNHVVRSTFRGPDPLMLAITPNWNLMAYVASDELTVCDLKSNQRIARFTGDSQLISCEVTPDGRTIIASAISGVTHFLRLEERQD